MKKLLLSVCVWMLVVVGAAAQGAIRVYCNDVGYLFAKADIDSIVCSCLDMDSVEHADWQTQVIYTSDSVYRIPLAVIDSVCLDAKSVVIGDAIDLGLSVKWASHNVGASSPEEYGGYYAWGETDEKAVYSWETYAYFQSGTGYVYIGDNISGTKYDVARVKWGGSWRMPTLDEIKELFEKCNWEWIVYKGVDGQLVTGPNGNTIFLPKAGYRYYEYLYNDHWVGCYWSGTLGSSSVRYACKLGFVGSSWSWSDNERYCGLTVRPVAE